MHTVAGDGAAGIKRRRRDLSSGRVRNLAMALGRGRLKEDLESSTWEQRGTSSIRHHPVGAKRMLIPWTSVRESKLLGLKDFKMILRITTAQ
ncbi:hypothetical protein Tco_0145884, partial [Tanacetum coccineum]